MHSRFHHSSGTNAAIRLAGQVIVALVVASIVAHTFAPAFDPIKTLSNMLQGGSQSYEELGKKALKQGNALAAQAYFLQASKQEPQNPDHYFNRSLATYALGDVAGSKAELRRALKADPAYAPAYQQLGHIAEKEEDQQEALRNFNEAIRVKPDYIAALISRGDLYMTMNKPDEALADYSKALAVPPKSNEPWFSYRLHMSRAAIYMAKQMTPEAIASYHAALDVIPANAALIEEALRTFTGQLDTIDPHSATFAELERLMERLDKLTR